MSARLAVSSSASGRLLCRVASVSYRIAHLRCSACKRPVTATNSPAKVNKQVGSKHAKCISDDGVAVRSCRLQATATGMSTPTRCSKPQMSNFASAPQLSLEMLVTGSGRDLWSYGLCSHTPSYLFCFGNTICGNYATLQAHSIHRQVHCIMFLTSVIRLAGRVQHVTS